MRTLVAGAIVLALGVGAGVAGALLVRSPDSAALDTAAPQLPPATAEVETGVLGESLAVEADFASSGDILVPVIDRDGIVTRVPDLTSGVAPGEVVLEVSGRPISVLPGDAAAYRDFIGGTRGEDVRTLQNALASLGFAVGSPDGLYGPRTAAAVEAFYSAIGYDAPAPLASPAELAAARAAVSSAEAALRDLKKEAEDAASDSDPLTFVDPSEIAVSAASVALAKEALKRTSDATLTPFPANEVQFVTGDSFEVVQSDAVVNGPARAGVRVLAARTSQTLWATVPRSVAARLTEGTPVSIAPAAAEGSQKGVDDVGGTVTWIASSTGYDGVAERFGTSFSIPSGEVGIELTMESSLARQDFSRLTATIELGGGAAPTLIVPLSAVRSSADGSSWVAVLIRDASGEFATETVDVTVLDTLSGRASVSSPDLKAGDHVVLG